MGRRPNWEKRFEKALVKAECSLVSGFGGGAG
jgi:hypothetical protein